MTMKLLDFFATTYNATFQKVSLKYFTNEHGRQFFGTDPGKFANFQISIIAEKGAEFDYFSSFFCSIVLFDAFHDKYHVRM